MALKLITPPNVNVPVVSTADAKAHLRVTHSDDDPYIGELVKVATQLVQDSTHYYPIAQTWEYSMSIPPLNDGPIYLPIGPLSSVTSIQYLDSAEQVQTWSAAEYEVETGIMGVVKTAPGESYPTVEIDSLRAFWIRFVVGYATAAEVPSHVAHAVKILLTSLYWERGKEPSPETIKRLMSGYAHPGSLVA